MKFALIGGDGRILELERQLKNDGHDVAEFALGGGDTLAWVLKDADCIVLPLPAFRADELNAPMSIEKYGKDYIIKSLPEGVLTVGGMTDGEIYDYYKSERLLRKNAAITAQCAVMMLQNELKTSADEWRVLILGYGRIGKCLCQILSAMGADVTAAARRDETVSEIRDFGAKGERIADVLPRLGEYTVIINTVPAQIIDDASLERAEKGTYIMELASAPYGFNADTAKKLGMNMIFAPGLPGKMMPKSAARAIKEAIYEILEEKQWKNSK